MVNLVAAANPAGAYGLPQLSTDGLLVAVTGLVIVYSLLRGYGALVRESASVYIGLVVAANFAEPLHKYLAQSAGGHSPVKLELVRVALLVLPIILLQFGHWHHSHAGHHKHHVLVTLLVAVSTALLLISSILAQLDALTLSRITDQSNLASWIYEGRLIWLAAVPVAIAISAVFKFGHHHR